MTAPTTTARTGRTRSVGAWRARMGRRAWGFQNRRSFSAEHLVLALLGLLAVGVTIGVIFADTIVPTTGLTVPLLVGSLTLGPRLLPRFVAFIALNLLICTFAQSVLTTRFYIAMGIQTLLCLIVIATSVRRARLGVAGLLGESMFVDLRDRILNQGGIPDLPLGWYAESALRSAGGTLFAGDFVVAIRPCPERLDVVVVDVSGKGEQAGTRALLLSGAFGGLLGALPPSGFLPAANDYLLRQDWDEGFATAVHLSVNLVDGSYELRTAGHPPAVIRAAGSGRWSLLDSEGPVLGLIERADFVGASGVLRSGDAILLYTDGMVEHPHRDIELGIDALLGQAEGLVRGSFTGSARRIVDALGSRDDDRAVLVVART